MPTKYKDGYSGDITAADVDAKLPRGYFVKRGDIVTAFGLTRAEIEALVPDTFTPAPIPARPGSKTKKPYARFVRSQVLAVARRWEREAPDSAPNFPKEKAQPNTRSNTDR